MRVRDEFRPARSPEFTADAVSGLAKQDRRQMPERSGVVSHIEGGATPYRNVPGSVAPDSSRSRCRAGAHAHIRRRAGRNFVAPISAPLLPPASPALSAPSSAPRPQRRERRAVSGDFGRRAAIAGAEQHGDLAQDGGELGIGMVCASRSASLATDRVSSSSLANFMFDPACAIRPRLADIIARIGCGWTCRARFFA